MMMSSLLPAVTICSLTADAICPDALGIPTQSQCSDEMTLRNSGTALHYAPMPDSPARVFLSYARKDGEAFASALRRRLAAEEPRSRSGKASVESSR